MASPRSHAAPVKLLALFVLLSAVPLAGLGWLGYRVLQQDRALEGQRLSDRLENAARLVARELDRGLAAWEELLPVAARGERVELPRGAVFLLADANGVRNQQGAVLPYYPRVAQPPASTPPLLAAAEADEFRDGNLVAAIGAYRALASSSDQSVRAEGLIGLARCFRKQRRLDDALDTYERLSALGAVTVAGSPAELVGRRERIALLDAAGDTDAAARERVALASALREGRFRIDRATFEYFGEPVASTASRGPETLLAAGVEAFWTTWLEQPAGRDTRTIESTTIVSVWRNTSNGTATITAPVAALVASVQDALVNLQVTAQLDDRAGAPVWGRVTDVTRVTKGARETGLPWTLHVAAADGDSAQLVADSRRNLFAAAFVLVAIVILASGYFVFRAVNRELAVARLQSDFVAAVSHEFRTPLTAMCHLTELLEQGAPSAGRLPEYYRALARESRRLHTMVENLLDFGRMDSGRRTYDFGEVDAVELVERVTQEYADRAPAAAPRIENAAPPADRTATRIRADREALALALRNLLDNALKYSPESAPVRLGVSRTNRTVAVSVEDRGAGIGAQERREIFRKFTRGTAARTLDVKGTGIGLTMADQIVKAHGGRLELQSEPGRGSTFTIVLPAAAP